MTNGTISITLQAPELVTAIAQLAEALMGKPMPAALPIETPISAIPAAAPTPAAISPVPTAAAVPSQDTAIQPPASPVPVAVAPTYTLDALARAGATLAQSGKMEEALALLARYGVQTVNQLKPEQYGAFATELRALGAQV